MDLGTAGDSHALQARVNVSLPGLEREAARAVVDQAHQLCPYSKSTRGNIDIVVSLL